MSSVDATLALNVVLQLAKLGQDIVEARSEKPVAKMSKTELDTRIAASRAKVKDWVSESEKDDAEPAET